MLGSHIESYRSILDVPTQHAGYKHTQLFRLSISQHLLMYVVTAPSVAHPQLA